MSFHAKERDRDGATRIPAARQAALMFASVFENSHPQDLIRLGVT